MKTPGTMPGTRQTHATENKKATSLLPFSLLPFPTDTRQVSAI